MRKIIVGTVMLSSLLLAQSAQEIINENGCLSCHAVASMKNAPAFAGIGRRNTRFYGDDAKSIIMSSIRNGSQGKYRRFADSAMPPYANLTPEQLSVLADYILAQAPKARGRGMGQGMGMGQGGMGRSSY